MSRTARLPSVCVALFLSLSAHAQCGGINTGGGNCTPPTAPGMPGYMDGNVPKQRVPDRSYISQWGAIAIDDHAAKSGVVTGETSESSAKKAALQDCREKGADQCRIVIAYDNECAAVAYAPNHYASYAAPTIGDAEASAVDACEKDGGKCQVVYSGCSLPRRVN